MYRILKYRKRWKHRMIELIVRDQTIDSQIKYGQKILRKEQDNGKRERTKEKELKGNCKVREKEKKWQKFQVHNRTQKAKRKRERLPSTEQRKARLIIFVRMTSNVKQTNSIERWRDRQTSQIQTKIQADAQRDLLL